MVYDGRIRSFKIGSLASIKKANEFNNDAEHTVDRSSQILTEGTNGGSKAKALTVYTLSLSYLYHTQVFTLISAGNRPSRRTRTKCY